MEISTNSTKKNKYPARFCQSFLTKNSSALRKNKKTNNRLLAFLILVKR